MSKINRDKKVLFDIQYLWGSLLGFINQATLPNSNPYCIEHRKICASRNELENFLIDLLAETIDKKMEFWICTEPAKEGLNDATD
ncbi:hypothetical protein AXE65_08095 [Ventosimonas gracilis]|uniref:Uncharacterized protein n=1 Tax=Ventosimonas gracilis TaxID=1680762 RepID=A0A139SH98_9GAMM|nr:hypothetical protein [Ventosimonas gracilis]KXU33913.1 hypothetical protein AXE65_08095 [Ventosimonas gracilis]